MRTDVYITADTTITILINKHSLSACVGNIMTFPTQTNISCILIQDFTNFNTHLTVSCMHVPNTKHSVTLVQ